ncbi:CDP-diacylglycerol--glycerol-3-phosphate 3-phosphatidyltransferase [Novosphingobium sp. TH158]|uniref:CDP-diacylglycerol--glycerol-3-phosphate 3-phosphatidyltransferase n=1 Tax=Novosphingobium sp. TH158 TaxID=2067455 RepID=UPI000C7CD3BF|nr:CDP-diacylglycerol--glycerol-3-phosphate 3-phosphatidyltransferase [Novosphingobium sp. TH158]PLK25709.1 CDP-diacylglycerol--glycerol-3-phosphate 3-phosphatidyltransferase [Novosphingobium sp. TH158]
MLTLPNILTLSRILAVPVLVALMWWPGWHTGYLAAWCVYSLMGITDYFDGYLARSRGMVSKLGQFLDPIADKIMIASVIVVLVANHDVEEVHVIAALVILLREIAVSGLREFLGGLSVSVPVSRLAKWKTTFQILALGSFILAGGLPGWMIPGTEQNLPQAFGLVTLWGAAVLTLMTGWDYLRVGLKHMD